MLDKNIVMLDGIIGDDFAFKKSEKEYATFSLCINSFFKEMADNTERSHSQTYVRIFVYDKRLIEYLKKKNAHRGQRISIFGRLSSCKSEIRGITFVSLNVVCRDLTIEK
jgi:hypothetical protein